MFIIPELDGEAQTPVLPTEQELINSAPPEYLDGKPFRDVDGLKKYFSLAISKVGDANGI